MYYVLLFCIALTSFTTSIQAEELTFPLKKPVVLMQGWIYDSTEISGDTKHESIDYGCSFDDEVVAAADGVAMSAKGGGYGNIVRIRHSDGTETLYAHLDSVSSTIPFKGEDSTARNNIDYDSWVEVDRGDVIGKCGTTETNIVHLHFEVTTGGYGAACNCRIDPYDIWNTKTYYPDFGGSCGENHVWVTCPSITNTTEETVDTTRTTQPSSSHPSTVEEMEAARYDRRHSDLHDLNPYKN